MAPDDQVFTGDLVAMARTLSRTEGRRRRTNLRVVRSADQICGRTSAPMPTGSVKWFNEAKGYGFVTPREGGPEAFVHVSAVKRAGLMSLVQGQEVSYELRVDPRTGRSIAVELKAL